MGGYNHRYKTNNGQQKHQYQDKQHYLSECEGEYAILQNTYTEQNKEIHQIVPVDSTGV